MKDKFHLIQKIICIFFITFLGFTMESKPIKAADSYAPDKEFLIDGQEEADPITGNHARAHYQLFLLNYDSVKNEAYYNTGCWYWLEKSMTLHSDYIYVNGEYQGVFDGNNGDKTGTDIIVEREQWVPLKFKSGTNIFETRNAQGVGGNSWQTVKIKKFASAPEVRGTNGTWYEGEVASGLRTWESLYTDGATGSKEGNKKQTATGFRYYDYDEANPAIDAYVSGHPISDNAYITKVVNQYGTSIDWTAMNNPGTYTIYSKTTDSGGLESAEGTRVVTVKERKYNINYSGNGATSGSTGAQTCTILHDCTLNNNGFSRAFNVSYNGNGGSPVKTSEVASATFLGWQDHNNFSYNGITYPSYVFNFPYYANTPGDIRNAFGYNKEAGISHWLSTSVDNSYENRQSSPEFSIAHYMAYGGSDLNAAFGNNRPAFVNHFIHNGYYEGRSGAPTVNGEINDTYPNRAVVKNLSLDDGQTLTLRAKWRDKKVTLPDAKRDGYKIIGWYTESNGGSKIGNVGDQYTISTNTTIYAHWDKAPEITASDKTFYEGEYTHDEWINTVRMKDVSAKDLEDGDITSNIKVVYDDVNVNVPGEYKVTYQVSDSVGQTVYKDSKVTVLYNNPPTITAEDRWFFVSEDVNQERLMERVKAEDIEDGDITKKATIIKSNVENHKKGDYEVTYEIIDAYGKRAETSAYIHIVEDLVEGEDKTTYLRFIEEKYLDTLHEGSEWRTPQLQLELIESLHKREDLEAEQIWKLSSEDIRKIQEFNAAYDYSSESNQAFLEQFQYLIK